MKSGYKHNLFIQITVLILSLVIMGDIFSLAVFAEDSSDDLVVIVIGEDEGDCTVITYGQKKILIDIAEGGSESEGIKKVNSLMEDDKDKVWDYVVFTHPDRDHIGNVKELLNKFNDNNWKIGTLIDFRNDSNSKHSIPDSEVYRTYKEKIKENTYNEYFSATEELNENNKIKTYAIDEDMKINVLYNKCSESYSNPNNLSVCILIEYKSQKLLFTGDLDENGEKELIKNHGDLIKNVTFFKAGHHGSKTSNSKEFIDWIRPVYVAITKRSRVWNSSEFVDDNSGNKELVSISRFLLYTDYIYPAYVFYYGEYEKLFGTTTFTFNGVNTDSKVECDNDNNNKTLTTACIDEAVWYEYLVDSFDTQYDFVSTYYLVDSKIDRELDGNGKVKSYSDYSNVNKLSEFNCTLIKYGHYDVLIDCGSVNAGNSSLFVEKLKDYVVDGVIEYLVVSNYQLSCISQLTTTKNDDASIFNTFTVLNVIDGRLTNKNDKTDLKYAEYLQETDILGNRATVDFDENKHFDITEKFSLDVYGSCNKICNDEDEYSLYTVVTYRDKKMMFVGDQTNYQNFLKKYKKEVKNVDTLRYSGSFVSYNSMNGLKEFLTELRPSKVFIGSPIGRKNTAGRTYLSLDSFTNYVKNTISNSTMIYACGYIDEDELYQERNGDIVCTLYYSGVGKSTMISVSTITTSSKNADEIDRFSA